MPDLCGALSFPVEERHTLNSAMHPISRVQTRPAYELPLRRASRLPGTQPGEVRPRRDHFIRLALISVFGWMAMVLVTEGIADRVEAAPAVGAVAGALVGYFVGRLQAWWLWKGEVPGRIWAPFAAIGWAAGAALMGSVQLTGHAVELFGVFHISNRLVAQLTLAGSGALAGGLSAVHQARVLRWRDQDAFWWVKVSAAATALGWSLLFLSDGPHRCVSLLPPILR